MPFRTRTNNTFTRLHAALVSLDRVAGELRLDCQADPALGAGDHAFMQEISRVVREWAEAIERRTQAAGSDVLSAAIHNEAARVNESRRELGEHPLPTESDARMVNEALQRGWIDEAEGLALLEPAARIRGALRARGVTLTMTPTGPMVIRESEEERHRREQDEAVVTRAAVEGGAQARRTRRRNTTEGGSNG